METQNVEHLRKLAEHAAEKFGLQDVNYRKAMHQYKHAILEAQQLNPCASEQAPCDAGRKSQRYRGFRGLS
jgi:hypothetical protein